MVARRLRSAFSIAIRRQRDRNAHAGQCLLRTGGEGEAPALRAPIRATADLAAPRSFGSGNLIALKAEPWMIEPTRGMLPVRRPTARASNATDSLSKLVTFSSGTKRTGRDVTPPAAPPERAASRRVAERSARAPRPEDRSR